MHDGKMAAVLDASDAHCEALPADTGGAGWTIVAGYAESPFGTCLIAECPRGLCHLSFEEAGAWDGLRHQWPHADVVRDDAAAAAWWAAIFAGPPARRLYVQGTAFQLKVWQALLAIPFGQSVSYGQVAARIGKPAAARAVGSAVGCNPIGFLIPCHRVVCASGALGGYRWGPDRKRALRAWEQAALKANRTPGFNQEPRIRSSATGYP